MRTRGNFALVLFMSVTLVAGSMAAQQSPTTTADSPKPSCRSVRHGTNVFKILGNQTYALCATSSSFVFNQVAYSKCDVKFGDSIMFKFEFDDGQDVCTVNEEGVKNGYMVSTFSPPASVQEGGHQAVTFGAAGRIVVDPLVGGNRHVGDGGKGVHMVNDLAPW